MNGKNKREEILLYLAEQIHKGRNTHRELEVQPSKCFPDGAKIS